MRHYHANPIGVLVGLVIVFFALMMFGAAMRQFGRGSCLSGCCLWELSDSLMEMGCGLMGCGGTLAVIAIAVMVRAGWH